MKQEHEHAIRDLRSAQDRIRTLVRRVDERINRLAEDLAGDAAPPPEPVRIAPLFAPIQEKPRPVAPQPQPTPSVVDAPSPQPPIPLVLPKSAGSPEIVELNPEPKPQPIPASSDPRESTCDSDSFEITFGRVWLVRIGIVILLTGLVFLGNLAYQHIVPRLGPEAKLSLIVLAGGALGGIGLWLERARESMRNYARVLIAGGCSTIYYATYAAHFVQALRVIESPLLGGALLLALAGGIGWVAHRKKSETLATLAVLLSYYTSGLNPIGGFTLFSSLLLTATATFFLLKHRWVRLTFVSLVGTYVSYAWSRQFLIPAGPAASALTTQVLFLAGYWLLFTAGSFFCRRESMPPATRAPFLTLNNGAFFALISLETLRTFPANFWSISLGFGAVLLGLSWLARWKEPEDRTFDSAYFVQGLALTTLGFASKLTGYQFALTLAAQSVILLFGAERHRTLRVAASLLSAAGAAWFALRGLILETPHAALTAGAVIPVLGFNGWFFKRRCTTIDDQRSEPVAASLSFAAVGLAIAWTFRAIEWPHMLPWLALGSLACAFMPLVFRFREMSLAGQLFYPTATAVWIGAYLLGNPMLPSISASLIASGAGLSIWWARQQKLALGDWLRFTLETATALCAAAVACVWMIRRLDTECCSTRPRRSGLSGLRSRCSCAPACWGLWGSVLVRSPSRSLPCNNITFPGRSGWSRSRMCSSSLSSPDSQIALARAPHPSQTTSAAWRSLAQEA